MLESVTTKADCVTKCLNSVTKWLMNSVTKCLKSVAKWLIYSVTKRLTV